MRTANFIIALLLLASNTACAQFTASDLPQSTGFIEERLDRIDEVINREVSDGNISGAVALIVKDGQIAYYKSFGLADIESQTPMRKDHIFRIASMTKAVTAVAAMTLYERGLFQLNDPVAKYIPEYANMRVVSEVDANGNVSATVPASPPIKIIDLFTHPSGISYPFLPSSIQQSYIDAGVISGLTGSNINLASQMKLLATQPLLFEPGSDYEYSLGLDLLGYLIEVISGKTWEQFFIDEIFTPLGMKDSHFYLPKSKHDRLATLYSEVKNAGLVVSKGNESSLTFDNPLYPNGEVQAYFSGGAGLSSTAYDYARFMQMLLNYGELDGKRLLSRKSVELMQQARIDSNGDQIPDYGLSFAIISDLAKTGEIGSNGTYFWGGAFNTSFWIDPKENLTGVFLSQVRPTTTDIRNKIKTMVYQALE